MTSFSQNQLLPNLVYSKAPAVVKGKVNGMTSNNAMQTIDVVCTPSWSTDEIVKTVNVNSDGTFETRFDVCVTSKAVLRLGMREEKDFFVVPGEEVIVMLDQSTGKITCEGALAKLNTSMANYYDEFREQRLNAEINGNGISKLRGMTVMQYRDKLMELYNNGVKRLNDDTRLTPEFREFMIPHYQFLTVALMTGYEKLLKYANQGQGNFTQPEGYYDVVQNWDFTSRNGFLYTNGGQIKVLAQQMEGQTGIHFDVPATALQLVSAKGYMTELDNFKTLTPQQLTTIKTDCPAFEELLIAQNNIAKAKIAENEKNQLFTIKTIDASLTGEDIFKAIVKDYKGKMVLVDFWATWCGPCRAAMKTILPVKEELWGKAAFVYVTGETSPKALWNKMIPDIHGDHYYVTAAQWDTLLKQFGVQGIPAYVIVDKENNIVTKHIGYPGNDVIKEELSK